MFVSGLVSHSSLNLLSVSPVLRAVVCPVSTILLGIQEELIFQVCSGIYLLLGQSGSGKIFPYMVETRSPPTLIFNNF